MKTRSPLHSLQVKPFLDKPNTSSVVDSLQDEGSLIQQFSSHSMELVWN